MRIERHLQVIDRDVASRYLPNTLLIFLILGKALSIKALALLVQLTPYGPIWECRIVDIDIKICRLVTDIPKQFFIQ